MKKKAKKHIKTNQGFTLLETLAAVAVLALVFTGSLALAWLSIRSAGPSQNQFVASYLAEEAMEYVKNRRDNNSFQGIYWLYKFVPSESGIGICRNPAGGCIVDPHLPDLDSKNIGACMPSCPKLRYDNATGLYCYSGSPSSMCDNSDPETVFTRRLRFTRISSYEEKVTVTIFWQERFGQKSFTLEENIFDWN